MDESLWIRSSKNATHRKNMSGISKRELEMCHLQLQMGSKLDHRTPNKTIAKRESTAEENSPKSAKIGTAQESKGNAA